MDVFEKVQCKTRKALRKCQAVPFILKNMTHKYSETSFEFLPHIFPLIYLPVLG